VLDTQGLLKSALIASQAQGRRCGYAAEAAREPLAARFYDATFVIPRNVHAVQRNRWLAAAAFDYPVDLPLDYGISAPPIDSGWCAGDRLVVLLTATSRDDKLWDEGALVRLGQALLERGLTPVLPAGNAVERQRAERIAAALTGAVVRAAAESAAGRRVDWRGQPGDWRRYRPGAPRRCPARAGHRPLRRDRAGADRGVRQRLRTQSRRRTGAPPSVSRGADGCRAGLR
jgi:hypothetical protein